MEETLNQLEADYDALMRRLREADSRCFAAHNEATAAIAKVEACKNEVAEIRKQLEKIESKMWNVKFR